MNTILITVLLVLILIIEVLSLRNNSIILHSNLVNAQRALDEHKIELARLHDQISMHEDVKKTLLNKKVVAFAITHAGIKALPEGWEDLVLEVWKK